MLALASSMRYQIWILQNRCQQLQDQTRFLQDVWLGVFRGFGVHEHYSDVVGGASASDHGEPQRVFADTCLAVALQCLGFAVEVNSDGPFWAIRDGNRLLAPFGQILVPVPPDCILQSGRYILHKDFHFIGFAAMFDCLFLKFDEDEVRLLSRRVFLNRISPLRLVDVFCAATWRRQFSSM